MDYQRHYDLLIIKAINRQQEKPNGYFELHHIIPKCAGGNNEQSNKVYLTPEEHFLAHQLLVKIYPSNQGFIKAAVNMCAGNQKQKRSNKLYGWLRRKYAESRRGRTNENDQSIKVMADKLRGRTKEQDP